MVTIKFAEFQHFKDFINSMGIRNPNRFPMYRFHTVNSNNTSIVKAAEIHAGGDVTFLYVSPNNETIAPNDPWFGENSELNYPPSTLVADIGEALQ